MNHSDQEENAPPQARADASARIGGYSRLGQLQVLAAAGFLGVLTAIVGLMIWTAVQNRGQLPSLTTEKFELAKQQWQAQSVPNYDITVDVAGRQAAVYHVEVRNDEVVVSTRNGISLKQRRTRGTWSVPGMFTTMQSDVDNAEQHRQGTAAPGVPQVLLRALFDSQFGYPQRYHRTELRKFGNNDVVSWEVTQFDVVDPAGNRSPSKSGKSAVGTLE